MTEAQTDTAENTSTGFDAVDPAVVTELLGKHRNGSGWFFWIAAFSFINSAVILSGSDWSFLVGLGITQLVDGLAMAIAEESGADGFSLIHIAALVIDLIIAASFALWGVLARKHLGWAYVVGIALYSLDGALFLLVQDWPSFGFHILALFYIFSGFKANRELRRLSEAAPDLGTAVATDVA